MKARTLIPALATVAVLVGVSAHLLRTTRPAPAPGPALEALALLGDGSSARDVAVDSKGFTVIVGGMHAVNPLPKTTVHGPGGDTDVFVMKLSPAGEIAWLRRFGGTGTDRAYAVEVDAAGFVYVAGRAGPEFPTTADVLQPRFGGDIEAARSYGPQDGFVLKLDADGGLLWSTFFGGNGREFIRDLAIDAEGFVHVAACEGTRPSPHIRNAFQAKPAGGTDGVVAKLAPDGRSVLWCTHLGGQGNDLVGPSIRVDHQGDVYVLGQTNSQDLATRDPFQANYGGGEADGELAKFSKDGALVWHTYFGGDGLDGTETHQLALDADGNPVIALTTTSAKGLPILPGAYSQASKGNGAKGTGRATNYPGEVFLAKISRNGKEILASTFFGGKHGEGAEGLSIDSNGAIVLTGGSFSDDLPVISGPQSGAGGGADGFVAVFDRDLEVLLMAGPLGGESWDVIRASALGPSGVVVAVGETLSKKLPLRGQKLAPPERAGENQSYLARLRFAAR